jgi:nitrogen regulatory protein PII
LRYFYADLRICLLFAQLKLYAPEQQFNGEVTDKSSLTKGTLVKLIIATIKPFKLEEVREAVSEVGVSGMMVSEIKGFGAQSGHTETYRGAEYTVNFVPKIKLEIAVTAKMADQVVEAISKAAHTGKIGDGKIFVLDLEKAMRVRTGETNEEAL